MELYKYDKKEASSIETYAKQLLGKCLKDVLPEKTIRSIQQDLNRKAKGKLGQIVEESFFGIRPGSSKDPDFPEAGVELKTTPLKKLINGNLSPKERLVLGIINYKDVAREKWETSSFLKKNALLLLMFYLFEEEAFPIEYVFKIIRLWQIPEKDLMIIRQDWEYIVAKSKAGKSHELSEGDTFYLGACTKGVNQYTTRTQVGTKEKAKQRAFAFKQKYLRTIVAESLGYFDTDVEPIVKTIKQISPAVTFDQIVIERFKPYIGKTVEEIRESLGVSLNPKAKDYYAWLARSMMGVKTKKIEEFEKADVQMKIIRLTNKGMPKESMSFPAIDYMQIVQEDWDESSLHGLLSKKFFFVVFQYDVKGELRLRKVLFWNMPYADIENEVKRVWTRTVSQIKKGHADNLPKISDSAVCHVRPHGRDSRDKVMTPYGVLVTKKSFWLNASYLKKVLESISQD